MLPLRAKRDSRKHRRRLREVVVCAHVGGPKRRSEDAVGCIGGNSFFADMIADRPYSRGLLDDLVPKMLKGLLARGDGCGLADRISDRCGGSCRGDGTERGERPRVGRSWRGH